jgi:hypothetical protein
MPKEKGRLLLVRVVMDGHTHNEMNAEGRQVFSLSHLFSWIKYVYTYVCLNICTHARRSVFALIITQVY